jgi:amino acid transporter
MMDSSNFDKGDELKGSDVEQVNEPTLETDEGAVMRSRVAISVNHRRLNPRQIHLTALAGAIGAALFVAIGAGALSGPLCLLVGTSAYL